MIDARACAKTPTRDLTGWKLHKVVFDARNSGAHITAICLAEYSINAPDKVLAGASYYEQSFGWEGLGCREAVAAIEASLRVRPKDRDGWRETCTRCEELKADCAPCN